jgi:transposase
VAAPRKYPDELRERAVRLYRESDPTPVIRHLAQQVGLHHEALRNWIRQAEADHGERRDRPTTAETEELRRQRKENAELRRANEILKPASASFAQETGETTSVDVERLQETAPEAEIRWRARLAGRGVDGLPRRRAAAVPRPAAGHR